MKIAVNRFKLPLALATGIFAAYLLRDQLIGSNWTVLFAALIVTHGAYSGSAFKGIKAIKLLCVVFALIGVIIYGKGWSAFLLLITYLALVAETKPYLTSYFSDLLFGLTKSVKGLPQLLTADSDKEKYSNSVTTKLYYIAIPTFIVFVFTAFYLSGSSFLSSFLDDFFSDLGEMFESIFGHVDIQWFVLFGTGILLLSAAINHSDKGKLITGLTQLPNSLLRPSRIRQSSKIRNAKKVFHSNMISLKIEYKLGCIVLISLNVLLLLTNVLDMVNLWFFYDPSSLRFSEISKFVHEGTYILIFSIILAGLVIIFYYRGNINFLKNNSLLNKLAIIWIAQNAILAFSVAIRNYHYIYYTHALTDKRLGVFIFLILVLIGLFFLYQKVHLKRSIPWLLKINFASLILVISVVQLVNWERMIIRFNFSNPEVKNIDVEALFREIDYDLIYLDKAIAATGGELYYPEYRLSNDAYEAWNRKKANYYRRFHMSKNKAWTYHKYRNLKELNFYEVEFSESQLTH